jgi:hypothetical protein
LGDCYNLSHSASPHAANLFPLNAHNGFPFAYVSASFFLADRE